MSTCKHESTGWPGRELPLLHYAEEDAFVQMFIHLYDPVLAQIVAEKIFLKYLNLFLPLVLYKRHFKVVITDSHLRSITDSKIYAYAFTSTQVLAHCQKSLFLRIFCPMEFVYLRLRSYHALIIAFIKVYGIKMFQK